MTRGVRDCTGNPVVPGQRARMLPVDVRPSARGGAVGTTTQ